MLPSNPGSGSKGKQRLRWRWRALLPHSIYYLLGSYSLLLRLGFSDVMFVPISFRNRANEERAVRWRFPAVRQLGAYTLCSSATAPPGSGLPGESSFTCCALPLGKLLCSGWLRCGHTGFFCSLQRVEMISLSLSPLPYPSCAFTCLGACGAAKE